MTAKEMFEKVGYKPIKMVGCKIAYGNDNSYIIFEYNETINIGQPFDSDIASDKDIDNAIQAQLKEFGWR